MSDQQLTQLVHDLCKVMHQHGYNHASVGALMRLIGVPDQQAQPHDATMIDLAGEFEPEAIQHRVPGPGVFLH